MTIRLIREDPENGMRRFYTLLICRDLFDSWNVVREWGRISQPGTVRIDSFDSELLATKAVQKHLKARLQCGYVITNMLPVAIIETAQSPADPASFSSPHRRKLRTPVALERSTDLVPTSTN